MADTEPDGIENSVAAEIFTITDGASELDVWTGQADRIWAHALHTFSEVVQRGTFYLLGESMLVVAYAAILTAGPVGTTDVDKLSWIARVIAGFGILLALIWAYAGHVHWTYLKHVREHALRVLPEYRRAWDERPKRVFHPGAIHTYAVPAVTALMWLMLVLLV